jgi:hypothetical protein
MQEYYKNCLLVIQPTGLKSVQESFLGEARAPLQPNIRLLEHLGIERPRTLEIPFITPDQRCDKLTFEIEPHQSEPLNLRGWVLQEQLLCNRIVILPGSGGLVWQCQEHEAIEGKVYDSNQGMHRTYGRSRLPLSPKIISQINAPQLTSDAIEEAWINVVNDYCERNLTNSSDKLIAIAAFAEEFGQRYDTQLGAYLAGHWRNMLLESLFWIVPAYFPTPKFRAPSWAWAAVDHATCLSSSERGDISPEVEILDCTVKLTFSDLPFGPVTSGHLLIRGRIGSAVLFPDTMADADFVSEHLLFDDQNRTNLIGEGHPDTFEKVPKAPTLVFLFVLGSFGLLLERVADSTYVRIGAFTRGARDFHRPHEADLPYNLLTDGEVETFRII